MVRTLLFIAVLIMAAVLWLEQETAPAGPKPFAGLRPRYLVDPLYWLRVRNTQRS